MPYHHLSEDLAYYAPMWRSPRIIRFLLWTLVLAVLTVKASGAHVHLCMDGQEPPASVHFADGLDDEHHQEGDQADKDVNPLFGALAKKGGPDFDLSLAVTVAVLSWDLSVVPEGPFPPELQSIPRDHSFYWRPPLRGPPA
jgi:hypothetical protein